MKKKEMRALERALVQFSEGNYSAIDSSNISKENLNLLEKIREKIEKSAVEVKKLKIKNSVEAAGVAHDLKTPLAVIMGAAECCKDGMDDKDYLGIISEKASYMSELIGNLTDASKQISGELNDFKETVQAREFFTNEFLRQKAFAEGRGIKIKTGSIPKNVYLVIDRKKISRVVQNIVTNAVKYSPKDSVIKVKYFINKGKLIVLIKDYGEGIAKENLSRVFDRFFMEDESRSEHKGGSSGLGLYVAKELAEEHGGEIKVRSKKGKGSTFLIYLPVKTNTVQTATERFNSHGFFFKLLITTCFGFIFGSVYRLKRYAETHYIKTLIGANLSIILLPFMWIYDILSIIFYGKITFLAD